MQEMIEKGLFFGDRIKNFTFSQNRIAPDHFIHNEGKLKNELHRINTIN